MIYLDYNATAPLLPAVREAMNEAWAQPLNPSSVHGPGRQARHLLEEARRTVAQALSAFPHEVTFLSGATEGNNTVLRAYAGRCPLLVAAGAHASLVTASHRLGGALIPLRADGRLDLEALGAMLAALPQPAEGPRALVAVMLANNETGVVDDVADIARIAHAQGALVHGDAVQALGRIPLDWGMLGADSLIVSAHKCGGPVGAATLLQRERMAIAPWLLGGAQEQGRRAGTQNVPAIQGFATAVAAMASAPYAAQWLAWRQQLEASITQAGGVVMGGEAPSSEPDVRDKRAAAPAGAARLPQTVCAAMPGVSAETQLMHFDLAGYAISAGSACSSGRITPSHVLAAMGVPPALATTAIRISWGWATAAAELEAFAGQWASLAAQMQARRAGA